MTPPGSKRTNERTRALFFGATPDARAFAPSSKLDKKTKPTLRTEPHPCVRRSIRYRATPPADARERHNTDTVVVVDDENPLPRARVAFVGASVAIVIQSDSINPASRSSRSRSEANTHLGGRRVHFLRRLGASAHGGSTADRSSRRARRRRRADRRRSGRCGSHRVVVCRRRLSIDPWVGCVRGSLWTRD